MGLLGSLQIEPLRIEQRPQLPRFDQLCGLRENLPVMLTPLIIQQR